MECRSSSSSGYFYGINSTDKCCSHKERGEIREEERNHGSKREQDEHDTDLSVSTLGGRGCYTWPKK